MSTDKTNKDPNQPCLILKIVKAVKGRDEWRDEVRFSLVLSKRLTHDYDYKTRQWERLPEARPSCYGYDDIGLANELTAAFRISMDYGFSTSRLQYQTVYNPDLLELEAKAKVIRKVTVALQKLHADEGNPSTPGDYVVMVARAFGITIIAVEDTVEEDFRLRHEYRWVNVAAAKCEVNRTAVEWVNAQVDAGVTPDSSLAALVGVPTRS